MLDIGEGAQKADREPPGEQDRPHHQSPLMAGVAPL